MRKSISILFTVFAASFFSGQITEGKRIIDSLNAIRWQRMIPDTDSLAEEALAKLPSAKKDTVILAPRRSIVEAVVEIPLTPFQIINTPQIKNWFFFGQNNLTFNQSSFNNWNAGGNNNIGIIGKINYNISYKKGKHFLENSLLSGYGFVATDGQATRKTEDYFNLLSNYGYELGQNYYFSAGMQLMTQFTPGYNYSKTPQPSYADRISNLFAPAYLNLGMGLSYNPNENFQIIVRPLNGKFTLVWDEKLQKKGLYGLEADGQSIRKELGAMVNILYRVQFYKDITLSNSINFFSNYLFHTERLDIAYNAVLNFRLNKFISTNITADLLYDHDQVRKLQVKQTLGIGISYNLGFEYMDKPKVRPLKPFVN